MRIVCAPPEHAVFRRLTKAAKRVHLFARSDQRSVVGTGLTLRERVVRSRLAPTTQAWDFLSIALAVNAADIIVRRDSSPDGWTREIDLSIAVQEPRLWESQQERFEFALRFLTTDIWRLRFLNKGNPLPEPNMLYRPNEDCCCLLSGGLDSLAGIITLTEEGKHPCPVSQVASGDKLHQREFAEAVGALDSHLQLNHNAHTENAERSQRARSVVFLAFGVLAATSLALYENRGEADLYVPENGFISLNPPLTLERLGSLSTRTTHPIFLDAMQSVLLGVGTHIRIRNPFQFLTKGELLKKCPNQRVLRTLAPLSTSCGRFARNAFQHCGRCVPCIIRRAAFRRWRRTDSTKYRYGPLGRPDRQHARFDDVRATAIALATVKRFGVERWLGDQVDLVQLSQPSKYLSVLERGLEEIGSLLRAHGVR